LKLNVPDEFHLRSGPVRVLKAVAEEGNILEAVFCGEVDGVKLFRSSGRNVLDLFKATREFWNTNRGIVDLRVIISFHIVK